MMSGPRMVPGKNQATRGGEGWAGWAVVEAAVAAGAAGTVGGGPGRLPLVCSTAILKKVSFLWFNIK